MSPLATSKTLTTAVVICLSVTAVVIIEYKISYVTIDVFLLTSLLEFL